MRPDRKILELVRPGEFVLSRDALRESCGKQCVDWAIRMLEEGHSGVYLQILASLAAPLDLRSVNGAYLDPTVARARP